MTYTKPTVRRAWGETATGADLTDPGDIYASAGWPLGQKPPRQYFNWVLNYTFAAVRYFCQTGVPAWDAAETYPINAVVVTSNGYLMRSLQDNNINHVPDSGASIGVWWNPPKTVTPLAANANDFTIPNTAWVHSNFLAVGSAFSAISGSIQNAQVPSSAVTQWQGALSIAGSQITGSVALAVKVSMGNGNYSALNFDSQSGQPSRVFGSNSGNNDTIHGWDPNNFSVANSQQLAGFNPSISTGGNTIALRDSNGYLFAQYFNQPSPNNENSSISQVMTTQGSDNFIRKSSLVQLRASMGVFTLSDFPSGNGWFKLPNGKIVQWGIASISGTTFVGFPIAFPSACQSFVMSPIGSSNQFFMSGGPGTTGVTVTNGTASICWVATGV